MRNFGWWIALGVVVVAVLAFGAGPFMAVRDMNEATGCTSNVVEASRAMLLYSQDWDDRLPVADRWMDLTPSREGFSCPALKGEEYGLAFFAGAANRKVGSIGHPEATPLVFDSKVLERNAVVGLDSMPTPGRHKGANSVGFVDGHARRVSDAQRSALLRP